MDTMAFFNPEHIYIFKRSYLKRRLLACGFKKVKVIPSRPLESGNPLKKALQSIYFHAAMIVYYATFHRIVITPAQLVYAEKQL